MSGSQGIVKFRFEKVCFDLVLPQNDHFYLSHTRLDSSKYF